MIGCSGCFAIASRNCDVERHRLRRRRPTMTSPAFEPASIARLAGVDRCARAGARWAARRCRRSRTGSGPAATTGVTVRVISRPLRSRPIVTSRFGRAPIGDVELLPRCRRGDRRPTRCGRRAGCRPAPPASRPRRRRRPAADPRSCRHFGALIQHDGGQDERQQQVHDRAHDEHLEPLPLASSTGTRRAVAGPRSSSGFSPAIFT